MGSFEHQENQGSTGQKKLSKYIKMHKRTTCGGDRLTLRVYRKGWSMDLAWPVWTALPGDPVVGEGEQVFPGDLLASDDRGWQSRSSGPGETMGLGPVSGGHQHRA